MDHLVYLDAFADAGETQTMLLYNEYAADYLLIDDQRGRKIAKINKIKTIGFLGVLLQAKQAKYAKLMAQVKPLITPIAVSPVFMGATLIQMVLELAGESHPSNNPQTSVNPSQDAANHIATSQQ